MSDIATLLSGSITAALQHQLSPSIATPSRPLMNERDAIEARAGEYTRMINASPWTREYTGGIEIVPAAVPGARAVPEAARPIAEAMAEVKKDAAPAAPAKATETDHDGTSTRFSLLELD